MARTKSSLSQSSAIIGSEAKLWASAGERVTTNHATLMARLTPRTGALV
jgi:hypothetical protein